MRTTVIRKSGDRRHLYCTVDSTAEYYELLKFIYNVRPLIASRFGVRERLVMYLKLAKKLNRTQIRDRTGISVRQIRKILKDMKDYFAYAPRRRK
jgi:DNA-directed RNA polymerase specialized sigma subunit